MYNALTESYHAANEVTGHDRGCAYGAGADCYCSRSDCFLVTVEHRGAATLVYIGDKADAASVALDCRASGFAVRLRKVSGMAMESLDDAYREAGRDSIYEVALSNAESFREDGFSCMPAAH